MRSESERSEAHWAQASLYQFRHHKSDLFPALAGGPSPNA
jgi:hypothetical protein